MPIRMFLTAKLPLFIILLLTWAMLSLSLVFYQKEGNSVAEARTKIDMAALMVVPPIELPVSEATRAIAAAHPVGPTKLKFDHVLNIDQEVGSIVKLVLAPRENLMPSILAHEL